MVFLKLQRLDKPGILLDSQSPIQVKPKDSKYVSRGGLKLEGALREFGISVQSCVCLDLGASTGGFTDCLLQHGARKVYAFDVGRGQMDWSLRQDPRVVVRDGVNVRNLETSMLEDAIDLVTVDLSFISLRLILPGLRRMLEGRGLRPEAGGRILALVKPQFEAERQEVGPGGLIRDPALQKAIVQRIRDSAEQEGFAVLGETPSPIMGQKGNQEYFLLLGLRKNKGTAIRPQASLRRLGNHALDDARHVQDETGTAVA